jgi:hypothetical protein
MSSTFQRSEAGFVAAFEKLQKALAGDMFIAVQIGKISRPDTACVSNHSAIQVMAQDVEKAIEELIQMRANTRLRSKETRTGRIKCLVQDCLKASYPFVNVVLSVAKEGAAVELWWRCTMHLLHIFMGNNAVASFMQGTMDLGACGLCCTDCALFMNGF